MTVLKNSIRNLIMNGDGAIRQRSAIGVAITNTYGYRVQDRFLSKINDGADFNSAIMSNTSLTDLDGVFHEAINMNANAANANAKMYLSQRIESIFAKKFAGNKASFSFEFVNRGFTDVTVRLFYADSTDVHTTQTLIDSKSESFVMDATTKRMVFENISIPSLATNGLALEIEFSGIDIGNAWDNAVSKIMLNAGSVAAPFRFHTEDESQEDTICKRYYERLHTSLNGRMNGGTNVTHNGRMKVKKRTAWVGSVGGNTAIGGGDWLCEYGSINTGGTINNPNSLTGVSDSIGFSVNVSGASGTNGHSTVLFPVNANAFFNFDAEL